MSILIDERTKLLVQGITGSEGRFHAQRCLEYGTQVVAGVTPGKGGTQVLGTPVFSTVEEAVRETGANASLVFVPAPYAAGAVVEAVAADIPVIICITEGIPVKDMMMVHSHIRDRPVHLIGPNCPGVISPGKCKAGIMVGEIHRQGHIGVVSRSGTLTYEAVAQLTQNGLGQSTCVGIGGDSLPGSTFVDILKLFQQDEGTEAVVLIGEIGSTLEQEAADFIKDEMTKPVIAFVSGVTAPPGRRMGHAGAIISGSDGMAREKIHALEKVGVTIAQSPAEIGRTAREVIRGQASEA